ncbi:MAG: ECF-type sigma factor [Pseudoxanthomonas suwonensis]|nr:ECF-type sigma factor [Pseudoxanthomonas suwonensis]
MNQGGTPSSGDVTVMLRRWQSGDLAARDALFGILHANLLAVARQHIGGREGLTLAPADLVHESLLRLLGTQPDYKDRTHLLATAALKVRSVLIDHIRARKAIKRGGDLQRVTLSLALEEAAGIGEPLDVFALHEALEALAAFDSRAANVIELTYFGGLDRSEIAMVLDVSVPTVDRDLRFGRRWLAHRLAA